MVVLAKFLAARWIGAPAGLSLENSSNVFDRVSAFSVPDARFALPPDVANHFRVFGSITANRCSATFGICRVVFHAL